MTFLIISSCNKKSEQIVEVYETSQSGNKLTKITHFDEFKETSIITLNPEKKYQTITGFGGAFTESSAYLLNKLGQKNRDTILRAYFSNEGARYSLTRTHMNSCDFSLSNYSYSPIPNDKNL